MSGWRLATSFVGVLCLLIGVVPPSFAHPEQCFYAVEPDLVGTAGDDVLVGTPGRDVIWGRDGNDVIRGGGGRDTLCGGHGDDQIFGEDGNDFFSGGKGNDLLSGGEGNDEFYPGLDDDDINGGEGRDVLDYYSAPEPVNVDLAAGTASGQGNDLIAGIEKIEASKHGGTLLGNEEDNIFWTHRGDDVARGGGGDDSFYDLGTGGTDAYYGDEGNDRFNLFSRQTVLIEGGAGNDRIEAHGSGEMEVSGDEGDDLVSVDEGTIDVDGGEGVDLLGLYYVNGPVRVDLSEGSVQGFAEGSALSFENVSGSFHDDLVIGTDEPNTLQGNSGRDLLIGAGSADNLWGGRGFDRAEGGDDDDGCVDIEDAESCESVKVVDKNDVKGNLDIDWVQARSISDSDGLTIKFRLVMLERWTNRDLADANASIQIDLNNNYSGEYYVDFWAWESGRLRATFEDYKRKTPSPKLMIERAGRRAITILLPRDLIPADSYWFDVTINNNATGCYRTFGDVVEELCYDRTEPPTNHSLS